MRLTRRSLLKISAGGVLLGGGGGLATWLRRRDRVDCESPSFDALVTAVVETQEEDLLRAVAQMLARGVSVEQLLAAAFHAPIQYGGDREDLHAMLVVPAALLLSELSARAPIEERLLPVFWAISNVNGWLKGLRRPAQTPVDRSYDVDRLLADAGRIIEDPHPAIYVAQSIRMLDACGWSGSAPVLASLTRRLSRSDAPLPAPVELGTGSDLGARAELIAAIRAGDAETATELALALLNRALSPTVLSDSVLLAAVELVAVDQTIGGPGLHAVTLADALLYAANRAQAREVKLHLLLRAVAWMSMLRGRGTAPPELVMESLEPSPDLRERIVTRGNDVHAFKYAAALFSCRNIVSEPWRSHFLGSARLCRGLDESAGWARRDEMIAELRRAGLD